MSLATQLTDLKIKLIQEQSERMKIEEKPEFQFLNTEQEKLREKTEELEEKKKEMLAEAPDSTEEYNAIKLQMIEHMLAEGLDNVGNIEAKYSRKNLVNTRTVMDVLQGDMDNFFLLASIKQTDLKKFEKENPEYKYQFKDCVEEISKELTDITINLPE